MPNREEMQARGEEIRERMAEELKLSDAQKEKMQSLMADGPPSSPEEARARFAAMRETLTPEQQSRMRAAMKKRLLEDPNSPIRNLPPDEQQKFMEKLEKRIESGEPPMLMMGPPPGMAPR